MLLIDYRGSTQWNGSSAMEQEEERAAEEQYGEESGHADKETALLRAARPTTTPAAA